jgi:sugar lactone lactonase YvrE
MCEDDRGGIFITSSGDNPEEDPFTPTSPASGSIYYLSPKSNMLSRIHLPTPIHYANGITFSPSTNQLYVSEHLKNRILVFSVTFHKGKVTLEQKEEINLPQPDTNLSPLVGPDGLFAMESSIYIAHFGTGTLLRYDFTTCDFTTVYQAQPTHPYITNVTSHQDTLIATVMASEHQEAGYVIMI